jgi:CCR4-NOT transcription complex subunit 3
MAANRKLQTEIQQVLKKVDEGVELFNEIWEKVYSADSQTLKEKYESDLKKEIKKLQRLRDQIKSWISSNDIKDKTQLIEARKVIESKMEQFKICERDTKTKAYSKEGLARDSRVDPKEAIREEKRQWLNDCLEKLNDLNNTVEAEKEKLATGKNKSKNKESLEKLDNRLQKQKWHIGKIELMIKLLDNEELDPSLLDGVKDSVEYYIETAPDDDGALGVEHEFDIYEDLALDSYNITPVTFDIATRGRNGSMDEEGGTPAVTPIPAPGSTTTAATTTPVATTTITTAAVTTPTTTTNTAPSNASIAATASNTNPLTNTSTATAVASNTTPGSVIDHKTIHTNTTKEVEKRTGPQPTVAQVLKGGNKTGLTNASSSTDKSTESPATTLPPPPGIAVAKSTSADEKSSKTSANESPRVTGKPENKAAPLNAAKIPVAQILKASTTAASSQASVTTPSSTTGGSAPSAPTITTKTVTESPAITTLPAAVNPGSLVTTPAVAPANGSIASQQSWGLTLPAPATATSVLPQTTSAPPNLNPVSYNLPPASSQNLPLNPMGSIIGMPNAPPAVAPSNITPEMQQTLNILKQSFLTAPEEFQYVPRNPNPNTHPSFPSVPLYTNYAENAALFDRLPLDTVFFSFYFQQNTFQQVLAARRLKKSSYRFHKKLGSWFQRHLDPKVATQDYEEGTYLYFDCDAGNFILDFR